MALQIFPEDLKIQGSQYVESNSKLTLVNGSEHPLLYKIRVTDKTVYKIDDSEGINASTGIIEGSSTKTVYVRYVPKMGELSPPGNKMQVKYIQIEKNMDSSNKAFEKYPEKTESKIVNIIFEEAAVLDDMFITPMHSEQLGPY